jgi:hypothetical protein
MKHLRWKFLSSYGPAQDIAEYVIMLAMIVLLVIGTVKLIGTRAGNSAVPAPHSSTAR